MPWRELSVTLPAEKADEISQFLEDQGAQAITLGEAGEEPVFEPKPGETPLWRIVRLTALYAIEEDVQTTVKRLQARYPELEAPQLQILEDQPWERVWLEHFNPLDFGRLWVCPTGHRPPVPETVCLELDPGLAFGTGTHPTTALCLKWLAQHDLEGATVIDYGCGSGILAIAALLLGANRVVACDVDPQALTATRNNAAKNRVAERLECCYPQDMPPIEADTLLANILADPLLDMASCLPAKLRTYGTIVLSGILVEQASEVMHAYAAHHIQFEPEITLDRWVRLVGKKIP